MWTLFYRTGGTAFWQWHDTLISAPMAEVELEQAKVKRMGYACFIIPQHLVKYLPPIATWEYGQLVTD